MNTTTPSFKREILGQRRVQISALCSSSSKRHFFLFFSSNSTRSSSLSNDDDAGGCGASREQQSPPGPIPRLIARQHNSKHPHTEEEDEVCTERETPTKVQDLHERNQSFQNKDLHSDMDCAHHQGHSDPPLQCARWERKSRQTPRERERERDRPGRYRVSPGYWSQQTSPNITQMPNIKFTTHHIITCKEFLSSTKNLHRRCTYLLLLPAIFLPRHLVPFFLPLLLLLRYSLFVHARRLFLFGK